MTEEAIPAEMQALADKISEHAEVRRVHAYGLEVTIKDGREEPLALEFSTYGVSPDLYFLSDDDLWGVVPLDPQVLPMLIRVLGIIDAYCQDAARSASPTITEN